MTVSSSSYQLEEEAGCYRANPINDTVPKNSLKSAKLWANRYRRLKEWVNSLPPLLILRVEKLIQVFRRRKSLHLRLADNYLIELWGHISRATVQRTLQQLGLLKRITGPPKRQGDGSWKHYRKLILLLPKKDPAEYSYLVSHFGPYLRKNTKIPCPPMFLSISFSGSPSLRSALDQLRLTSTTGWLQLTWFGLKNSSKTILQPNSSKL